MHDVSHGHVAVMSRRIGDVLGVVGEESEISLQSLVDALVAGGYLPLLWETEEVWRCTWTGWRRVAMS